MDRVIKLSLTRVFDLMYPPFRSWIPYQVYVYLAAGGINTLYNIALFAGLYEFVLPEPGLQAGPMQLASYTVALIIAFLLSVPTGFWLSKHMVFDAGQETPAFDAGQFIKYFVVVLQGLVMDYLLMMGFITFFGIDPVIAKVIATVTVLTINFILQKFVTFGRSQRD